MQILSFNFFLYTISGMWRPIEWSSKCSKILYSLLTCLTIYLLTTLTLTQLLDIILVIDNVDDFATNSLMLLSAVSVLFKVTAVVTHRDEIINLIETLQKKPCKAYNEKESDIQMKFDRLIRSYSISYTSLASFSVTGTIIGGLLNILEGQLPYRMWVPYDCTLPILFWFTSIQELVAIIFGTIVNVATETTVLGFCLQICAQIEILKHRLEKMTKPSEEKSSRISLNDASNKTGRLSEHILHHLCIIRFVKQMIKLFYACQNYQQDIQPSDLCPIFRQHIGVVLKSVPFIFSHDNFRRRHLDYLRTLHVCPDFCLLLGWKRSYT
ncbi:uncharacterized protein LOC115245013 isoform X1 [Formica exsecta]|uniref:uncharacterized protein LOC115245013 isoform X1 n=1 Tax=Formica exsecta TaxID=72781 RepID=UPI001143263B|nr:uncharacterized protein LOC115245013 isoform X1 [Formica exsecta]